MGRNIVMTRQNLTLLKFPHSDDEIISERIEGLNRLLCESGDDAHVNQIIEMLVRHISNNFEGIYIEATIQKLIEAHAWWSECYDPNVTLNNYVDFED